MRCRTENTEAQSTQRDKYQYSVFSVPLCSPYGNAFFTVDSYPFQSPAMGVPPPPPYPNATSAGPEALVLIRNQDPVPGS